MWPQIISLLLILSGAFAGDNSDNSTTGFEVHEFWTRENGDSLVYTQTELTNLSNESDFHRVEFTWKNMTQRATQIILVCNANCTAKVVGGRFSSELHIHGYAIKSKQLIATVLIYALHVGPGILNP